jgi:hypothetical protein
MTTPATHYHDTNTKRVSGRLKTSYRLAVSASAAVIAATLATGVAGAATGHPFRLETITESSTAQSANYPNPGSSDTSAGRVSGLLGNGRIVQKIQITGHPTPTTYTFQGSDTTSYANGTVTSSFSGTAAKLEGALIATGQGHYTGGTRAYRRARGRYGFAGTLPSLAPTGHALSGAKMAGTIVY